MNVDVKCRVFPRDAALKPIPNLYSAPLDDFEKKRIKGLPGGAGFMLALVIFCVVVFLGTSQRWERQSTYLGAFIAAAIVVTLGSLSVRAYMISVAEHEKAEQIKRSTDQANKGELRRAEDEAQYLTRDITTTYESSAVIKTELPVHLKRATNLLQQADNEFKENAFGPFWDAVEGAAKQLAVFNDKTNQMSRLADKYYKDLNQRRHTFPSFPASNNDFANASPAVNELRRIVRMGQTNFQFANIWEHRRTREVMIAGFQTLGDAINNLGSTVENSVFGLERSISSDMARSVQEGIKTRDSVDGRLREQNRMLDNIQHHRTPGAGDSPSRY